jgi:hypothetical protein
VGAGLLKGNLAHPVPTSQRAGLNAG